MWSELRQRDLQSDIKSKENLAFEFVVEEKLWKLTSALNHIKLKQLPIEIVNKIRIKVEERGNN